MPDVQNMQDVVPTSPLPFEYPFIRTDDNSYLLPTYSQIVYTAREVDLDILDTLQMELEVLLSATVVRSQIFQTELDLLKKLERKRVPRKRAQPTKRTCPARTAKEIQFTKFQEVPKFQKPQPVSSHKRKVQKETIEPELTKQVALEPVTTILPKRSMCKTKKTAHKYWLSVDRYCRPINQYDLKCLNTLIDSHKSEIARPFEIPALGEHYSCRWAKKDLMDQEFASDPRSSTSSRHVNATPSSSIIDLLKKSQDCCKSNGSPDSNRETSHLQSVLTKKLNKVLEIEMKELNTAKDGPETAGDESHLKTILPTTLQDLKASQEKSNDRKFHSKNTGMLFFGIKPRETVPLTLEDRLKRDLTHVGVMENNKDEKADDEIVTEIKRCQKELLCLVSNNLIQLERCSKLAQQEMIRQERRKKLRTCDSAIVEVHQKISQSKLKKQPIV